MYIVKAQQYQVVRLKVVFKEEEKEQLFSCIVINSEKH